VDTAKELRTISLCHGYGGIERGIELAGTCIRHIAISEIEAYSIANTIRRMEEGEMAPCPIWTNLKTFPDPEALKTFMVDNDVSLSYNPDLPYFKKEESAMGAPRMKKYDEAAEMYKKRLSIQDIAEFYGVSRQSMHKILKGVGLFSEIKNALAMKTTFIEVAAV